MGALTDTQSLVLEQLRVHCRRQVMLYRGGKYDHLHQDKLARIQRGDQACAFCLGGLTFQIGHQLHMPAAKVLRTFKALKAKGMVLSEDKVDYQRPLYWWPVGLAGESAAEIGRGM